MTRIILTFLTFVFVLFNSSVAFAADERKCDYTAYGTVKSGYVFGDIGVVATDKPVFQSGVTAVCDNWAFDIWNSVELGNGVYGERGGDEIDFDISYSDTFHGFRYAFSVAYFAVPITALDETADDIVRLYVDVSRPVQMDWFTITPALRHSEIIGVGTTKDLSLTRFGITANVPLWEELSFTGNIATTFNHTDGDNVLRYSAQLNFPLWELNWKAGVEGTDQTESILFLGASYTF